MGFSIGDAFDVVEDIAGAAVDAAQAVGDVAGKAASVVGFANPAVAIGLATVAGGTDMLGRLADTFLEQQDNVRNGKKGKECGGGKGDKGDCEGSGGAEGGGSIFEQIALAMGSAMDNKLNQLLEAADKVSTLSGELADKQDAGKASEGDKTRGQGDIMTASAQVTARSQELNTISQAFNSSINAVGQAVSTAASKR
jgi:hypothetical protein